MNPHDRDPGGQSPAEPASSGPISNIVRCERHGIRYNSETHWGCVRCRKEAGEAVGPASPPTAPVAGVRAGPAKTAPVPAGPAASGPTGPVQEQAAIQVLIAAVLVIFSSTVLYLAHREVYETAPTVFEQLGGGMIGVTGQKMVTTEDREAVRKRLRDLDEMFEKMQGRMSPQQRESMEKVRRELRRQIEEQLGPDDELDDLEGQDAGEDPKPRKRRRRKRRQQPVDG